MTMAPDGRLWAVEGGSDRFSIFTTDGEFVESWGRSGVGEGEFDLTRANGDPYGMIAFARDGSFYVLDAGNRRIQHFAGDRTFLRAWGTVGNGPGQFNDPVGLAVDSDGNVHVLDDVRRVIDTFDADGNLLRSIPAFPAEVAVATVANGLSIGPNGHFYVTAAGPSQVLELDLDGSAHRHLRSTRLRCGSYHWSAVRDRVRCRRSPVRHSRPEPRRPARRPRLRYRRHVSRGLRPSRGW